MAECSAIRATIILLPQKARGPSRKRIQRDRESQRQGASEERWYSLNMAGPEFSSFPSACGCIHKTCTRVSQLKLQHGWGGMPEAPSLTKKLLAADGRPERDESFCSGM